MQVAFFVETANTGSVSLDGDGWFTNKICSVIKRVSQ